jgi:hypothetical protein
MRSCAEYKAKEEPVEETIMAKYHTWRLESWKWPPGKESQKIQNLGPVP